MNTLTLGGRLAAARAISPQGTGWLDALTLIAHTVTAWLALTTVGGTWMFYRRIFNPVQPLIELVAAAPNLGSVTLFDITLIYLALSALACVFLVFPILGLGSGAARLGSRGRTRRLAVLRLLGASQTRIVKMSLVESLTVAVTGFGLGSLIYLVSLPAWQLISFQKQPIRASEILLPWWLWLGVGGLLLFLTALSTLGGLLQVNISPLGVAKRQTPRRLHWARLVFAPLLVIFAVGFANFFLRYSYGGMVMAVTAVAFTVLVALGLVSLVSPYLLQALTALGLATNSPARLLAVRRILDDPKAVWRQVSGLAFLGAIAGFMVFTLPSLLFANSLWAPGSFEQTLAADIMFGSLITLAFALVTSTVAIAINQASQILDRADQSLALSRMGMPRPVLHRARSLATVIPMALVMAISLGASTLVLVANRIPIWIAPVTSWMMLLGIWLLSVVLAWIASATGTPLENRLIQGARRKE